MVCSVASLNIKYVFEFPKWCMNYYAYQLLIYFPQPLFPSRDEGFVYRQ